MRLVEPFVSATGVAVDADELDDLLDDVDDLRGRSGAGPMLSADLRKSLLATDLTGDGLSLAGAGGGFSGDFCFGGVFCFPVGPLPVDDRLPVDLELLDFDKLNSFTLAASVDSSRFSGTSLFDELTLVSRLKLGLSRLYRDDALE